jgi:bifunctional DNA-binding transcriptional regulator/antitoxin component of YhaV-PrlF toxin-antitoxin module
MAQSKITSKYRTTIPKEIREKLGLGPQAILCWELAGAHARVSLAQTAFLNRQGSIPCGAGSASADVRRARTLRGTEGA